MLFTKFFSKMVLFSKFCTIQSTKSNSATIQPPKPNSRNSRQVEISSMNCSNLFNLGFKGCFSKLKNRLGTGSEQCHQWVALMTDGATGGCWLCKEGWVCAREKLRQPSNTKHFTSSMLTFTGQLKNGFSLTNILQQNKHRKMMKMFSRKYFTTKQMEC